MRFGLDKNRFPWRSKRSYGGFEDLLMCPNLVENVSHFLTVPLQFFNCFFNGGNKILLAVSGHFGMHTVAFTAASEKTMTATNKLAWEGHNN